MEETNNAPKQDMIDRKGAWLERMFDRLFLAVQKNPFATMLILSVGLNFWQFSIYTDLNKARILDITTLNEKINIAVEKRVNSELPKQIAPIQAEQEERSKKTDTSLNNLNQALDKITDKYLPNTEK